jgi:hypothetical protein
MQEDFGYHAPIADIPDALDVICCVANDAASLARAFRQTGNQRAGSEIAEMAKDLRRAADAIRTLYGKAAYQKMMDANRATGNMLRGVLAGISVGTGKPIPAALAPIMDAITLHDSKAGGEGR